ncbi:hypothetical protein KSS87_012603, partial [Heliosperma pusillum]
PIKNLKVVDINFGEQDRETNNEALIEKLQPNRNLMELRLTGYNGSEITRWGRSENDWSIILPKLVSISLERCDMLHGIPLLSNLKHLKFLCISRLNNVEYMETNANNSCGFRSKDLPFFPSLESLYISGLYRLKGWWGGVGEGDSSSGMPYWQPPFPRLSRLLIIECAELTSFPPCPSLEFVEVKHSNKSLRILPDIVIKFDDELER